MDVYVNLLGNWTKLTENDSIDGAPPEMFIDKILISENAYETSKITNDFFEVCISNTAYHIHKSNIQYVYKK